MDKRFKYYIGSIGNICDQLKWILQHLKQVAIVDLVRAQTTDFGLTIDAS